MELIEDWPKLWKAWSTRAIAFSLVAPGIIESMPPDLRSHCEPYIPVVMWLANVVALISRGVKQSNLSGPAPPNPSP